MREKIKSLSTAKKILLGAGSFVVLILLIGAMAPPPAEKDSKDLIQNTSTVERESTDKNEQDTKREIEAKTIEETIAIPYQTVTHEDPSLSSGETAIAMQGVNGTKTITYEITYTNGDETNRKQIAEHIDKQPINEVKKIGTKVVAPAPASAPSNCDPNYSGCVPIASDVDCVGGSGSGPAYASGPVNVIGSDIYRLDSDNDGVACE